MPVSIIGTPMFTRIPGTVRGEPPPGPAYWQGQDAFLREVQQRLEGPPVGTLIADLDASAFQCNEPRQANGCTLSFSVGWVNGAAPGTTNSQRLTAPILLPVGRSFSSIVFNVFGDSIVAISYNVKARAATGAATTIATGTSALSATAQSRRLAFPAQTSGQGPFGTYFVDVDMPPNAGQSLRLWSAQIFA